MNSRTKDIETVFRHGFGRLPNFENKLPEPEKVAICKKWLSENAKRKRVPKDECINSYGLKHRIEEEVGEYITNGACIQAAIELGFAYWRGFADWRGEDFINARFYMELNIKPENRLEKAIGFSKWLFEQDDLYFYGDPAIDPDWPRKAIRFIDFWRHLSKVGGEANDAQKELCRAWRAYSGNHPPRPDLIDTEMVYNQECDFISFGDDYPKASVGNTYLYALVEIEEPIRVRYIGQTDNPSKRLSQHMKSPGDIERVKWIGGLMAKGKYPKMAVFQEVAQKDADLLEQAAIYAFSSFETYWDDELGGFPSLDVALLNRQHQKHKP